jgi:osmotically-inducible protein OsmY
MSWTSPDLVAIGVDKGEVTLEGRVDTETIAESIMKHAQLVPGVVGVDSKLTWPEPAHR